MENEDIAKTFDTRLAINTGLTIAVAAIISTSPNYDALQLALTRTLEQQLGDRSSGICAALTAAQKNKVRALVEYLGGFRPTH